MFKNWSNWRLWQRGSHRWGGGGERRRMTKDKYDKMTRKLVLALFFVYNTFNPPVHNLFLLNKCYLKTWNRRVCKKFLKLSLHLSEKNTRIFIRFLVLITFNIPESPLFNIYFYVALSLLWNILFRTPSPHPCTHTHTQNVNTHFQAFWFLPARLTVTGQGEGPSTWSPFSNPCLLRWDENPQVKFSFSSLKDTLR